MTTMQQEQFQGSIGVASNSHSKLSCLQMLLLRLLDMHTKFRVVLVVAAVVVAAAIVAVFTFPVPVVLFI